MDPKGVEPLISAMSRRRHSLLDHESMGVRTYVL